MDLTKGFFFVLGSIALIADIITVGQFIFTGNIVQFWTMPWIASICFIILLFIVGAFFFSISEQEETTERVFIRLGGGYIILAVIFYTFFAYSQFTGMITIGGYFGHLILLTIVCIIGIGTFLIINPELLFLPSFGFALANLGCILFMLYKYVFTQVDFHCGGFIGEVIIVVIGAVLHLSLYATAKYDIF